MLEVVWEVLELEEEVVVELEEVRVLEEYCCGGTSALVLISLSYAVSSVRAFS